MTQTLSSSDVSHNSVRILHHSLCH
jgi:hypothetical protein